MVGETLRMWRKRRGLSQAALGKLLGTSGNMIGIYEREESSPTMQRLQSIAEALDVSLLELVAGPDDGELGVAEPAVDYRALSAGPIREIPFVEAWDGGPVDAEARPKWPVSVDLVPHDGCLVTRVRDDSMEPFLLKRDAVAVDPEALQVSSGDLVLVRWRELVLARRFLTLKGVPVFEAYDSSCLPLEASEGVEVVATILGIVERDLHRVHRGR